MSQLDRLRDLDVWVAVSSEKAFVSFMGHFKIKSDNIKYNRKLKYNVKRLLLKETPWAVDKDATLPTVTYQFAKHQIDRIVVKDDTKELIKSGVSVRTNDASAPAIASIMLANGIIDLDKFKNILGGLTALTRGSIPLNGGNNCGINFGDISLPGVKVSSPIIVSPDGSVTPVNRFHKLKSQIPYIFDHWLMYPGKYDVLDISYRTDCESDPSGHIQRDVFTGTSDTARRGPFVLKVDVNFFNAAKAALMNNARVYSEYVAIQRLRIPVNNLGERHLYISRGYGVYKASFSINTKTEPFNFEEVVGGINLADIYKPADKSAGEQGPNISDTNMKTVLDLLSLQATVIKDIYKEVKSIRAAAEDMQTTVDVIAMSNNIENFEGKFDEITAHLKDIAHKL